MFISFVSSHGKKITLIGKRLLQLPFERWALLLQGGCWFSGSPPSRRCGISWATLKKILMLEPHPWPITSEPFIGEVCGMVVFKTSRVILTWLKGLDLCMNSFFFFFLMYFLFLNIQSILNCSLKVTFCCFPFGKNLKKRTSTCALLSVCHLSIPKGWSLDLKIIHIKPSLTIVCFSWPDFHGSYYSFFKEEYKIDF